MKFRKQVPIGPYIADFVCFEKRLIIEVDGGQHKDRETYDKVRTTWLQSNGFEVMRFWDNDVLKDPEAVVGAIYRRLTISGASMPPHPNPPPPGGRE